MDTKTLTKIKTLTSDAAALAGFHAAFAEKYADGKYYDKQGYGFSADGRFAAFSVKATFDSWYGTYGSSSAYTALDMQDRDAVSSAFVKALNANQKLIFATMAKIMREEAASLTEKAQKEISALQQMLSSIADLPVAAE